MDRRLIVGLCWDCHAKIHSLGLPGKIECLAILCLRRPEDYDLEHFWKINGRRWPDAEDVAAAMFELL